MATLMRKPFRFVRPLLNFFSPAKPRSDEIMLEALTVAYNSIGVFDVSIDRVDNLYICRVVRLS